MTNKYLFDNCRYHHVTVNFKEEKPFRKRVDIRQYKVKGSSTIHQNIMDPLKKVKWN